MLAKLVRELPKGALRYEPKWDGFRALVFRDEAAVDIRSRNDKKLARYFPEVVEAVRGLPCRDVVLDGEIVVVAESGLDFAALMSRLHPAASRVDKLRRETPAAFVAFDVLALDGEDLRARPLADRRVRLEALLRDGPTDLFATPQTTDAGIAAQWLASFTGNGVDGVIAKDAASPYVAGQRRMIKVKRERTADCVVAGIRLLSADPPAIGSLLLGLYDEHGALVHLGVASQLTKERRARFVTELAPLIMKLEGHPWERGFGLEASPLGRLSGSAGRWSPDEMERDWIPIRPERVCEVAYDILDGRRLRFPARFVRWRDDRDASSCTFEQMEQPQPS